MSERYLGEKSDNVFFFCWGYFQICITQDKDNML